VAIAEALDLVDFNTAAEVGGQIVSVTQWPTSLGSSGQYWGGGHVAAAAALDLVDFNTAAEARSVSVCLCVLVCVCLCVCVCVCVCV
jgi:hypothetical protein